MLCATTQEVTVTSTVYLASHAHLPVLEVLWALTSCHSSRVTAVVLRIAAAPDPRSNLQAHTHDILRAYDTLGGYTLTGVVEIV